MARRTRRPAVVWLPLSNVSRIQLPAAATDGTASSGFQLGVAVPSGGPPGVQTIPIAKDEPQNIAANGQTLSDLEGSAYRLRRIVGKVYIQPAQIAAVTAQESTSFIVVAGIIVLRVDTAGNILSGNNNTYDPGSLDSTRDPWVWRRSWLLSNVVGIGALNTAAPDSRPLIFPESNIQAYAGGVMDGPHVDAKTARVISDEERLFFTVSAVGLDGETQGLQTVLAVFGEFRVLASMRKSSGNRRNASR